MKKRAFLWILAGMLLVGTLGMGGLAVAAEEPITITVPEVPQTVFKGSLDDLTGTKAGFNYLCDALLASVFQSQHPNIRVEYTMQYGGDDTVRKLLAELAGGVAPDAYIDYGKYYKIGAASILDDYYEKWEMASKIPSSMLPTIMKLGHYYSIPDNEVCGYSGFSYRKDWFQELGIFDSQGNPAPPDAWTVDDFKQIVRKVTDPKKKRWGYGFDGGGAGWVFMETWADILDVPQRIPDKTGEYTWRFSPAEELVRVFEFYHDMVFEYDQPATLGSTRMHADFWGGNSMFDRAWMVGGNLAYALSTKGQPGFLQPEQVGATYTPRYPDGIPFRVDAHVRGYTINPSISQEKKDAVWEWLTWRYAGEGWQLKARLFAQRGLILGMNPWIEQPPEVYELLPEAWKSDLAKVTQFAAPPQLALYDLGWVNNGTARSRMIPYVQRVITEKDIDLMELAKQAEAEMNKVVTNYKDEEMTLENMRAYYADMGEFYKTNYPEYYEKRWKYLFNKYFDI